ncbi:5790043d-1b99-4df6-ab83-f0cf5b9ed2f4 [Thermothielavioides terrestris]|uniref:5790043d-1b99-4df6-ab83-f0cf5b9ed2f4 n=1 Tax=Thermothielavioides terrestris TaxID=2587410 RepID=A0A3S4B1C9_9PEZI|nr:5790043d-1b99-4df6-ab83-f0cf5b9ed2f4 [Thermothielavioides terrestris]
MSSSAIPALRRALLYVPASSPRMLAKSLTLTADNVTYDLEDSVTASMKDAARAALQAHLAALADNKKKQENRPASIGEIAVRINGASTRHAEADIRAVAALASVDALVVPKVNSPADLAFVEDAVASAGPRTRPLKLLALVESARAVMDLRDICGASSRRGGGAGGGGGGLAGLIFAAEDFALDLSLRRTPGLAEFLYARSAVVTAARAFGLESAIDLSSVSDCSLDHVSDDEPSFWGKASYFA